MTPEDVAARAAAFEAAEDPLGLGHAVAAERWRELEAAMRAAGADSVAELPERERARWERRLNARSRVFSRPDAVPPEVAEPPGLPFDATERSIRVKGLGRTRNPLHARTLAAVLRSDDGVIVRAEAARGLGSVGGEDAVEALLQVTPEHPRIRNAMATSLGLLGDPRGVPKLIGWLEDEATRGDAAEALGRIGDPAAVPALERLLTHQRWSTRTAARGALVELGHPDAVAALRRHPTGTPFRRRRRLAAAERAVARRLAIAAREPPPEAEALVPRLAAGGTRCSISRGIARRASRACARCVRRP